MPDQINNLEDWADTIFRLWILLIIVKGDHVRFFLGLPVHSIEIYWSDFAVSVKIPVIVDLSEHLLILTIYENVICIVSILSKHLDWLSKVQEIFVFERFVNVFVLLWTRWREKLLETAKDQKVASNRFVFTIKYELGIKLNRAILLIMNQSTFIYIHIKLWVHLWITPGQVIHRQMLIKSFLVNGWFI